MHGSEGRRLELSTSFGIENSGDADAVDEGDHVPCARSPDRGDVGDASGYLTVPGAVTVDDSQSRSAQVGDPEAIRSLPGGHARWMSPGDRPPRVAIRLQGGQLRAARGGDVDAVGRPGCPFVVAKQTLCTVGLHDPGASPGLDEKLARSGERRERRPCVVLPRRDYIGNEVADRCPGGTEEDESEDDGRGHGDEQPPACRATCRALTLRERPPSQDLSPLLCSALIRNLDL